MQDKQDIPGAGYEYDFTWWYTLETGYSILAQWKDTTQVYNSGETDETLNAVLFATHVAIS